MSIFFWGRNNAILLLLLPTGTKNIAILVANQFILSWLSLKGLCRPEKQPKSHKSFAPL